MRGGDEEETREIEGEGGEGRVRGERRGQCLTF